MNKFLALAVVLCLTLGLAAQAQQSKPEQKPNDKPVLNVAGNWSMTLEMSMGTGTPTLVLKQDAEKITGSYTGRYGTFALEGTIKERTIIFSFTMAAEGESVLMTFTGEVAADAQTMKGKAALGDMGEATWSAKRDKTPE
jgi:hypothetical protein